MTDTETLLAEVAVELKRARTLYSTFVSGHEGYAVLKEEVDELWDEIKASKKTSCNQAMREECIQIAAMALRFVQDLSDKPEIQPDSDMK